MKKVIITAELLACGQLDTFWNYPLRSVRRHMTRDNTNVYAGWNFVKGMC